MMDMEEITRRMHDGDPIEGGKSFERLIRLAGVTDDQQRYMWQSMTITPQMSRDMIAYLATQGIVVTAVPIEEGKT